MLATWTEPGLHLIIPLLRGWHYTGGIRGTDAADEWPRALTEPPSRLSLTVIGGIGLP